MSAEGPKEGQPAPEFDLPTDNGGRVSLAGLRGRPFVLYFYPKDDTPGCTQEAMDFAAAYDDFSAAGVEVVGVSKDSVASHDKFKIKCALPFPLASDEESGVVEAYGAWVEKSMYGKKSMGTERCTFLIDAGGKVRRVWRNVKVAGHVGEVLQAARDVGA
jgi:thioredoxin-dependent peroxiredoxin